MCVILFILQRISVTNIILPNNAYDISITCLLLRSVKIWIIYTLLFPFIPLFFKFYFILFMLFCFVLLVRLNEIKKYLAETWQIKMVGYRQA